MYIHFRQTASFLICSFTEDRKHTRYATLHNGMTESALTHGLLSSFACRVCFCDCQRLRPMSYAKSHVILIAFAIDTPDSLENVSVKVRGCSHV